MLSRKGPYKSTLPEDVVTYDALEQEEAEIGAILSHDGTPGKEQLMHAIASVRAKLVDLELTKKEESEKLAELVAAWEKRRSGPSKSLQETRNERMELEAELAELTNPPETDNEPPPPGPKELRWVDGTNFLVIASVVIVVNVFTMLMEMFNKAKYGGKFFYLNHCFMVFYVFELGSKAILHRLELWLGPILVVWWNWLDTVIVVSGVLDMWIMPFLQTGKKHGGGVMGLLRILRLARLLRLARVVKDALADLSWTEGQRFEVFIMGVIGFNASIMGFECDYPDWEPWWYIDNVLLVIFTFELWVRLRHFGLHFFCHPTQLVWNWLDFIIVVGGVLYAWVMPCFLFLLHLFIGPGAKIPPAFGQLMTMLRMLRLIRILRLIRLVKSIPQLYTLIQGIIVAMQGMLWVVVLTFTLLYALALVCVSLFGHGLAYGGNPPDDVKAVFSDVLSSIYVLFDVMNGSIDLVAPVYETIPATRYGFMLYVVISTWSILSILTAVVSDNMIKASEEHQEEEDDRARKKDQAVSAKILNELFDEADTDGSQTITKQELEDLLTDEDVKDRLLYAASLGQGNDMSESDLTDLWTHLCSTHPGEATPTVHRNRFISGLQEEGRLVTARSVMRLEKKIDEIEDALFIMQKMQLESSLRAGGKG